MKQYFLPLALALLSMSSWADSYTVFSDGMPAGAIVSIQGKEFSALNTSGQQFNSNGKLTEQDITVIVGGGYMYSVMLDNTNRQIDVKFTQIFQPTASVDSEKQSLYLLKDASNRFIKKDGVNTVYTTQKAEADKFIFVENSESIGTYYIYNVTAGGYYLYYTSTDLGAVTTATSSSNVRTIKPAGLSGKNATWRITPGLCIVPATGDGSIGLNYTGGNGKVLNLWKTSDSNSKWEIIDPSAGSMACATTMFSVPGAEYMHKLIPNRGEHIVDVTFGEGLSDMQLCTERSEVGNKYQYVHGYAPTQEGEYSYTVTVSDGKEESQVKVTLTVSNHLQSPRPMMGWLTWNWFQRNISSLILKNVAKGLEKKGLIAAGYDHLVIDDCWAKQTTDKAALTYDTNKFLSLPSFVEEMHNMGLKVGIYSDAGSMTCENYQPGSYGYEAEHLAKFNSWGIDMLKYDYCNNQAGAKISYTQMGNAVKKLNEQRIAEGKTPFEFNACEWGQNQPWLWAAEAGASSWRATGDSREEWNGNASRVGVLYGFDIVKKLWMYAGVNRFNDADMMMVGLHGLGSSSNNTTAHMSNNGVITGLTDAQARSQMSLWSMMASPLTVCADFRTTPAAAANTTAGTLPRPLITDTDIETLSNKDIIAINQDVMGQQAEYMESLSIGVGENGYDVLVKDLSGRRMAVAVANRSAATLTYGIQLPLSSMYMNATSYICKDVWTGTTTTISDTLHTGVIAPHETRVFLLEEVGNNVEITIENKKKESTKNFDAAGRPWRNGLKIQKGRKSISKTN